MQQAGKYSRLNSKSQLLNNGRAIIDQLMYNQKMNSEVVDKMSTCLAVVLEVSLVLVDDLS